MSVGDASNLMSVPTKLAAHQVLFIDWGNGFQYLHLLVANAFAVEPCRRLHREIGQNLKQVILNYVTNYACLIVKSASPLHAEILGQGDLYTLDVVAVPERLNEGVCKAEY